MGTIFFMKKLFSLVVFVFCTYTVLQAQNSININTVIMDTIYTVADNYPSYKNGDESWKKYLKKNLKYPKKAWWEEIEADVVIEFIVRKDGTVTNIKHLTVSEWGFEEEATRLVKECGKWNPAIKNGKTVDFKGQITIPFRLRISKGE